jgi:hypothetical protein
VEQRQGEERREDAYQENARTLCLRICSLVVPVNTDGGWRSDKEKKDEKMLTRRTRERSVSRSILSFSL